MTFQFNGRTAIVTGAGSGIGAAVALAFARASANLALCDVNQAGMATTASAARALGVKVITFRVDVTQAKEVSCFVTNTIGEYGKLDFAANCAGIRSSVKPFAEHSQEEFERVMSINTLGVWICMKYEIEAMLRNGGAIVNIASGAGIVTVPSSAPYVASKHAVIGLTKSAAVDYAKNNIRINCVCPGYTRTPMALAAINDTIGISVEDVAAALPIGRIAEPVEQANAVLYLCSDEASFMVGHALVVDGGHSII
jgi:NAD(P)-dependent dehydrogenase (short-subunit alcohol dehydrogenase family)